MLSLLRCEWYQVRKSMPLKIISVIIVVASAIFGVKFTDANYVSEIKTLDEVYILSYTAEVQYAAQWGTVRWRCCSPVCLQAGWLVEASRTG